MAIYTVTTTSDVVDANDGVLSLREAVTAANSSAGADSIAFATSLLPVGHVAGDLVAVQLNSVLTITDTSGSLAISGDVDGDGTSDIAIDGQNETNHFIVNQGSELDLTNLSLQHGNQTGADGADDFRGDMGSPQTDATSGGEGFASIYNSGTLHLTNVMLSSNSGAGGHGGRGYLIFDYGDFATLTYPTGGADGGNGSIIINAGTMTMANVVLSGNTSQGGSAGSGLSGSSSATGATILNNGTFSAEGVTFAGNTSGGSISCEISGTGALQLANTLIHDFSGTDSLINNGGPASGAITIYNAPVPPVSNFGSGSSTIDVSTRSVEFATQAYSVSEGNGGTTTITVTLTRPDLFDAEGTVTVSYIPSSSTAYPNHTTTTDGNDFASGAVPADQVVTFAAGQQTATVTFEINGDYILEPNEQFSLYLSAATGQQINHDGVHDFEVITLVNDDTSFSIAPDLSSALEGTPLTFTVTRSGLTSFEQTVNYAVAGSGQFPTNGVDFDGGVLPSGTVTFAAGQTTATITIPVHQDQTVENDETFTVTLSGASDHGQIGTAVATGTVLNDDALYFAMATTSSQFEGNSGTTAYEIQLIRSGYTANAVTVDWTAVAGTADATDFPGGVLPSGQVTFAAGQTIATVEVLVAGDETPESNENFTVAFSINGSPVAAPATLTILDDDQISGTAAGSVGEDATLTAGGTLVGEPSHAGATPFQPASGLTGTYGTFTFDEATGIWGYTLNNAAANVQGLTGGQVVSDQFTVTTFDGEVSEPVVVTITGANDAATISGTAVGNVAENGTLTAGGTLTVTDVDTGQNKLATPASLAGACGMFTLDTATGVWGYTLDNTAANVQALSAGQVVTDSITVKSLDGTASQALTVTITGASDVATITGTATGSVVEDGALVTGGKLTVTDVDAGENSFAVPPSLAGTFGTFSFNATSGGWSYSLSNNAANVQALTAGQIVHDTLVVKSFDGSAQQMLAVAIVGTNEAAVITGTATGAIAEDGTLTAGGTLTVTDPDAGQNRLATPTSLAGIYGTYSLNTATGVWGYTLDNTATNVQALTAGQVVHDSLVVTSIDGTATKTIDVTISGNSDAPTAVTLTPVVTTIAENTVINAPVLIANIAVTDIDGGTNTLALTGTDAASFSIVGNGLYLKAGVALDFETKASYAVAVTADDGVSPSPDATSAIFSLGVTNVSPETLTGTAAADVLTGGTDLDLISGLAGDDTLDSGVDTLADRLTGGLGNDIYIVRSSNDVVVEAFAPANAVTNFDRVRADVSYTLATGANIEHLRTLTPTGTAAINLTGNELAQQLTGNAGNNILTGAGGRDVMVGGNGADTFKFMSVTDTTKVAGTRDVISDFTHNNTLALSDRIDLSAIDANGSLAGNIAFTFQSVRGAAFTGTAGQLHYIVSGSNTVIEGDINGDKLADFQIELTGLKTLVAADFLL